MSSPIWVTMDTRTLAADTALDVLVRRPAGTSASALDAQLRPGLAVYLSALPADAPRLKSRVSGVEGTPMGRQLSIALPYVLAVAVLLTLLIACANVAVLMFAQWTARDREIAIRASIGASRRRIVQQLVTESAAIAAAGGVLGVAAALMLRAVILRNSDGAQFFDLSLDPAVFLEVTAVTLGAGILAGLLPACFETRRLHLNPLNALRGADVVRQRLRNGLVVLEIGVTVALLVVTTAMVDGYRRARDADMGFETARLMTARVESPAGMPVDEVLRVVSGLPGVAAVGASTSVPFGMAGERVRVSRAGDAEERVEVERADVRGTFFDALGVPIVAGRSLADRDVPSTRAVVINQTLATLLFPDGQALGAIIRIASVPHDVIGIARDYASNPFRAGQDEPRIFLPLGSDPPEPRLQLIVLADGDPAPLVPLVRREVSRLVPGVAVSAAITFPQVMRIMGQEMIVATAPLVPLISIATLLTLAGIYGVLAFAVSRRSRELAVRVAVGAAPHHLILGITRSTVSLVATGTAIGIAVTFGLARLVRAGGGAGSIYDPAWPAFVLPIAAIVAIGLIAAWLPARRAVSIDPVTLLRAE
jgi:predicted permease